jgi:hypothetical protein
LPSVRAATTVVVPPPIGPTGEARQALERRRRIGGQWFYWIAGLSLVNAAVGFAGGEWRFILGLGVTQVVQALAKSGSAATTSGLIALAVIAIFAVLGQRAVLGHGWAFLVGITLFALDGGIFLLIRDWAGVGFHAFALLMITRGYVASRKLAELPA